MHNFLSVVGKKIDCMNNGIDNGIVFRKKNDDLANSRVVRKKIDCMNDGLADGKEDRLHLCLQVVFVIACDGRI